jgi:hypothetical protein
LKDRFKASRDRQRMHRFGREPVDRQTPREFLQPYRPPLSKGDLRELLASAVANSASIKIQRVQPNKAKR